jgi:translation initiation factor 3 subunit D
MNAASGAYHYRKFELDGGVNLVARCAINAYCKRSGSKKLLMTVRCLNEFDSKMSGNVDWRQKLETQTGAVLATEMKNNNAKLARWTAETILSGADEFRLGFVSRMYPKDSYKHIVLMSKRFEPKAFAQSINVKISNLWGVLKVVLEGLRKQEDGTYLLMKDPNKACLNLFSIPPNAFDHEMDEE